MFFSRNHHTSSLIIYIYINLSAFFAAALQHLIFCCKASFCCNAGIRHKPQHDVWYTMKLKQPVYQENGYVSISTVHSKTHSMCPIDTGNVGPMGPVRYPVQYHHLEFSPYPKARLMCQEWFKELLYQENGCVPITYGTFQDPQGLSYPHKKYWTHRSIIRYYIITLNRVLTQRQVWYAMYDSKSYCTRKMAAPQSRTVHSKTHKVCTIHTRNIGPIGLISSAKPSPWIESLPRGRTEIQYIISRATVPGKWLRPYHVRYILRPTVCVLSTQEILDPSVQYPVQYHHLESSPYPNSPAA